MKPFTLYHINKESIFLMQEKLVSTIEQVVKPEMIWLLGASRHSRRTESIFNAQAPTSQYISDYFLLILLPDLYGKPTHEWQDRIEQQCSGFTSVTVLIQETATFKQWYQEGRVFARKVYKLAVPFYRDTLFILPELPEADEAEEEEERRMIYTTGINKTREFLAGAELYQARKQYTMAAFMLHQSTEQALRTLLKLGMGFHISTHNLERLLRYARLISPKIPDIFSQRTQQDKRLFTLLQKAYSDSRYKSDYIISLNELTQLNDKVKALLYVLKNSQE